MTGEEVSEAPGRSGRLAEALEAVHDVLNDAGIWHCLAFGTLLGAVRDRALIAWDHDIDLWVRPSDRLAILDVDGADGVRFVPRIFEGGQLIANPYRVPSFDIGVFTIIYNGGTAGELWAPTLFADGAMRQFDLDTGVYYWPQSSLPHHHFETLAEVEVNRRAYPSPAQAATLLEWLYGPDWRTPIRARADRGHVRPDRGYSGELTDPRLRAWIRQCEDDGWSRQAYVCQPSWPRPIRGAGPLRTTTHDDPNGWQTLEQLARDY